MPGISERRKYILDSIVKQGFLKVSALADTLGVTQTTIRKDLSYLESKGLLYRAYGSALPTAAPVKDISLGNKKLINYEAKQKIAALAVGLIEENDSIIISSGSTVAVFVDAIKPKGRLNVVSTAVNVSAHLGETPGVTVMQVGGLLYSNTLSVTGIDAVKTLSNVYCSKAFFGTDGLSADFGLTCGSIEEAELTQQMIRSAKETIVLCDSSKIGKKGFARICGIEDIDILISDSALPASARAKLEDAGVKVLIS